ncbi:hypothetical protein ACFFRR_008913 [Megaselia abdita]
MTTILKLKLNKLSTFWLFTILFIGNGATVAFAAPAEDFSELLSLVPPNKEATIEYTDSYGNPIATADGKKVVNAKGIQFEIPNYASGITAIRKPYDNLQPPLSAANSEEKNVFKATLPPWLADFNDPDVGPGVPYVFKDEDGNQEGGSPQGIVESSSNSEVVVSSTTPSPILSSTTATPAQTFTAPPPQEVKGHLASNSVFPSTATTTHFQVNNPIFKFSFTPSKRTNFFNPFFRKLRSLSQTFNPNL